MSLTSASLKADESEFSFAEIEGVPSVKVTPLSVANSTIRYECTLREVISISDLPTGGKVVLLDVQCIYIQDDLYDKDSSQIKQQLVDTVGKLGGDYYSLTTTDVEITRP